MKRHMVYGTAVEALYTKELHRNYEVLKSGNKEKYVLSSANMPTQEIDMDIVAAASESYCISPNPEDYIVIPLPIVTVDIPNRNLQGFPTEEVTFFDPAYGQMVYQTFKGKYLCYEHQNSDPTKAKGIIVDASLKYVPKYDVWKIHIVTLWDRTKDVKLVQDILSGKRTGYSMGASVSAFSCSICGWSDCVSQPCAHEKGKVYSNRLAYHLCCGSVFFETSSVESPADTSAISHDIFE